MGWSQRAKDAVNGILQGAVTGAPEPKGGESPLLGAVPTPVQFVSGESGSPLESNVPAAVLEDSAREREPL